MYLELTPSSVTQSMMQLKHTHTKRSDWPSNEIWHEKMSLPLYFTRPELAFFLNDFLGNLDFNEDFSYRNFYIDYDRARSMG